MPSGKGFAMPFDPIDAFFMQSTLPFAMLRWRPDGILVFTRANDLFCQRLGTSTDALRDLALSDAVKSVNAAADPVSADVLDALRAGRSVELGGSGTPGGIRHRIGLFSLGDDRIACILLEAADRRIGDELAGFVDATGDFVCIMRPSAVIVKANRRFADTVGKAPEELVGMSLIDLLHADDVAAATEAWRDVESGAITGYVSRLWTKSGRIHDVEWTARVVGDLVFAVGRDATGEAAQKLELEREADTDALTGLHNRRYYYRRIHQEMERADRLDKPFSVILVDIDHFKDVNDTWGHPVGDDVLERVARLLEQGVRKSDSVCRVGGEEFFVLMPDCPIDRAAAIAERLRQQLAGRPMPIAGLVTASFGVTAMERQESSRSLYRRADAAMYHAKQQGRNRVATKAFDDAEILATGHAYFQWKPEWNSNHPVIDAQHRRLIDLGRTFALQVRSDPTAPPDRNLITSILVHAATHFTTEEEILRRIGFAGLEHHRAIHAGLLAKAKDLVDGLATGTVRTAHLLMYLVDDILIGHMLDEDVKFFPAFAEIRTAAADPTTGGIL